MVFNYQSKIYQKLKREILVYDIIVIYSDYLTVILYCESILELYLSLFTYIILEKYVILSHQLVINENL